MNCTRTIHKRALRHAAERDVAKERACVRSCSRSHARVGPVRMLVVVFWAVCTVCTPGSSSRIDRVSTHSARETETERLHCSRAHTHTYTYTALPLITIATTTAAAPTCVRSACLHSQSVAERCRQQYTRFLS